MSSASKHNGKKSKQKNSQITRVAELYPSRNEYPLGTRFETVLRYSNNQLQSTGASGAFASYAYNLNSLFDPNRTGAGIQPKGYDQMAAFFNRYLVNRAKVTLVVKGIGTATPDTHIAYLPHNDTTTPSDIASMIESPGSRQTIVGYGAAAVVWVIDTWLHKLNGVTKPIYEADERFQATVSNSPSEIIIGTLGFSNPGSAVSQFQYSILIEYYCTFFDPVVQGTSSTSQWTRVMRDAGCTTSTTSVSSQSVTPAVGLFAARK